MSELPPEDPQPVMCTWHLLTPATGMLGTVNRRGEHVVVPACAYCIRDADPWQRQR